MNRLIIVGYGFDLAHGLPTGYCDFIDWYWKDVLGEIQGLTNTTYKDKYVTIDFNFSYQSQKNNAAKAKFNRVKNYNDLKIFSEEYNKGIYDKIDYTKFSLIFYNSFFGEINDVRSIQDWVDIENEYYQLLKNCLKEKDNSKVKKLNDEFEQVKQLLERYLNEEVCSKVSFEKPNDYSKEFLKHFIVYSKHLDDDSEYLQEFPKEDWKELKEKDGKISNTHTAHLQQKLWDKEIEEENLFLNFNYTMSLDKYIELMGSRRGNSYGISNLVQIHGRLSDPDNKINFGFGDEMDKHYQEIEEKDDNEYLKYIKSFQYLQNSNYKKVLDFINSGKFQVYIMGHSCGLSDRILLNTIFEHTNCVSIKVFYYKNGDWDNYTEIVQNISRHFNKKKLMRDKIVNKSLCQPLPQNIRFEAWNPPSGY